MADETNEDDSWLYGNSEGPRPDNDNIETNGKDGEYETAQGDQADGQATVNIRFFILYVMT